MTTTTTLHMRNLQGTTYQKSLLLHQHAEIPRRVSSGLTLVDDNRVQQTPPANRLDHWILGLDIAESRPEHLTKSLRTLRQLFLLHDLERGDGDGAAERVAAVRRPVRARLHRQHHLLAT